LDAAVLIAFDTCDVTGLSFGEFLEEFEGGLRAVPIFEEFSAAPTVGEELEDTEVGEGLAGGVADLLDGADAAFGVDEGSGFFSP